MTISLDEAKTYLRVDYPDDDELLSGLISTAEEVVAHVTRMSVGELPVSIDGNIRTAVLYTVAYLYEHREEADHRQLMLNLRSFLFGERAPAF